MTKNKTENSSQSEVPKVKKELTEEQKQKQKKLLVYPLMVLLFLGSMWLIFAPSKEEKEQLQVGFNTDIPAPTSNTLYDDKQKAYEEDMLVRKEQERQQLQDLASMFEGEESVGDELHNEEPNNSSGAKQHIEASANAYHDINQTLGNFYETPQEDSEKEEMREKMEELNARLQEAESAPKTTMDEQIALLEKSYELAAKYMPSGQQVQPTISTIEKKPIESYKNGKAVISNVELVHTSVISSLLQPLNDSAFMADCSEPRNYAFNTAVGIQRESEKNTIKACVHDNQSVTDGQAVRMRLLEAMRAGNTVLPQNTLVTGMSKIQGDRLAINISTLEYQGMIIPVELAVIDTDGQQGIFIPSSMEMSAVNEIAANLGGNLGTTINLNQQNAGDQLLTDLGKGAIQGASQYISKKMRIVKVHLKAGYQLMLYQNNNQEAMSSTKIQR